MRVSSTALDYSMFGFDDHVNVILQRSDVLSDVPKSGQVIKKWTQGEPGELEDLARAKNVVLMQRAVDQIGEEYDGLRDVLKGHKIKSVADIGCGYAFFDLFLAREFGAKVHLIDIENNTRTHFGFHDAAAAYSNLEKAADFLAKNGVDRDLITTTNPEKQDVSEVGTVDLAVSFLACGFHFPVDAYMPFFRDNLAPGGKIILDLRNARRDVQMETLSEIGEVAIFSEQDNRARVIVSKSSSE